MRQPTEAQKLAAKERRERFRGIVQKIAKMSADERLALAASIPAIVTVEGRALSVHNQCLLASQCASATVVGGFRQWKQNGRSVRKGEHGLMIWCPIMPGQSASADTPQPEEIEGKRSDRPRFIVGTVFDVSQTCEAGEFSESEAA
jgi:N-terminal domain of anti-restriction factor ArdC